MTSYLRNFMSFKVVVREREDGDFDVVFAVQDSGLQDELNYSPNTVIDYYLEFMNRKAPNETFSIKECEVVTDVLSN